VVAPALAQPLGPAAERRTAPGGGGHQRGDPLPVGHRAPAARWCPATAAARRRRRQLTVAGAPVAVPGDHEGPTLIGLVTDSNAQLPLALARRYGVEIVPLTVTIDGHPYLEGTEIDADGFYARFAGGHRPEVSTAAPGPGPFARAFATLAGRGAGEILAVHIGSALSGTLNSARLAAEAAPVPVRLVDTGTASFGVACCVWEAAEALARGASLDEAAAAAARAGREVRTVFTAGALDLAEAGGRLAPGTVGAGEGGIPVLTLDGGQMRTAGHAHGFDEAVDIIAGHVLEAAAASSLRVGLGIADASARPWWEALEARLAGAAGVGEMVRYRIGPSVGAHTGPGTAGVCFYPSPLTAG